MCSPSNRPKHVFGPNGLTQTVTKNKIQGRLLFFLKSTLGVEVH